MAPRLRRAKQPTREQERRPGARGAPDSVDPATPLRKSVSEATQRVDEIIDAAEKAAAEIRADAGGEPRRRRARARAAEPSEAGDVQKGGATSLRQSMSDAKRRIEEVIDAAERTAAEIRAEAEAEASRLIETRREEAAELRAEAERHLTERRKEAAEIRAKAEADAGRLLEDGRSQAAEVRAEAEAEGARYLAARRADADRIVQTRRRAIAELSQSLLGHAQKLREQGEQLAAEVEHTVARIREVPDAGEAATPGAAAVSAGESGRPRAKRAPATPNSGRAAAQAASSPALEGVPEEALLRATQMAVEGTDRSEIDRILQRKFGLENTGPILDEILGREA